MPPQSRGPQRPRLASYSQSTPNLTTLKSLAPLDTSVAHQSPSNISTAPHGALSNTTRTNYEPFPNLDGPAQPHPTRPANRNRSRLIGPDVVEEQSEEESSEEESSEEEDEEEEEEESSNEEDENFPRLDTSSDEQEQDDDDHHHDDDEDEASSSSSTSDNDTSSVPSLSQSNSSQPSTLRPSTSVPSSVTTSPQKRPSMPDRTQSLYAQPPSVTKSQPGQLDTKHLTPTFTSPTRTASHRDIPAFAPPFYNRPPTPLPPSPSLTSLLRPPFSAIPSRPATPGTRTPVDSGSDTDATHPSTIPTNTNTVPTPSAAASTVSLSATALTAPVQVPSAPKIPTYEYYGFVLYITSSFSFFFYLLWSYLPTPFLHALGIYYYPNRWWSLAIPAWLVMVIIWIYVALGAYNTGTLTEKVGSLGCFVDEKGAIATVGGNWGKRKSRGRKAAPGREKPRKHERSRSGKRRKKRDRRAEDDDGLGRLKGEEEVNWREIWNEGTDAVLDVPIGGVCEVLYGDGRDEDRDRWESGEVGVDIG